MFVSISLLLRKGLWAGLLAREGRLLAELSAAGKAWAQYTLEGNAGPTLPGECDQVTEPESTVSG